MFYLSFHEASINLLLHSTNKLLCSTPSINCSTQPTNCSAPLCSTPLHQSTAPLNQQTALLCSINQRCRSTNKLLCSALFQQSNFPYVAPNCLTLTLSSHFYILYQSDGLGGLLLNVSFCVCHPHSPMFFILSFFF